MYKNIKFRSMHVQAVDHSHITSYNYVNIQWALPACIHLSHITESATLATSSLMKLHQSQTSLSPFPWTRNLGVSKFGNDVLWPPQFGIPKSLDDNRGVHGPEFLGLGFHWSLITLVDSQQWERPNDLMMFDASQQCDPRDKSHLGSLRWSWPTSGLNSMGITLRMPCVQPKVWTPSTCLDTNSQVFRPYFLVYILQYVNHVSNL